MMRKLTTFAVGIVLLGSTAALAVEKEGTFALGFSNSEAPVGLRYFMNEQMGLDLGLGFESKDLGEESGTSFWFEAGLTYVVKDYEQAFFFVRPALGFASLDNRVYGSGPSDEKWTKMRLGANLGAEVRLAHHFGLTFQHGLAFVNTSVPDEVAAGGEDSFSDLMTTGENITEAGVWFTF